MHGRGRAWQERKLMQRTIRILLECILVFFSIFSHSDVDLRSIYLLLLNF